ncbi:cerebellin-3-like [Saccostrea echinata]|uniref:cerebellin-3-like n=1 Tax=Saccostrea echinata TaxID=191078 RepID=UPI002A8048B3|nr:cerebellin-3-like [Saccostrea echinata]
MCINEKITLLESKAGPTNLSQNKPTHQISFMATASRDIKPIVGGTLIFDQVLTNKGGAYNRNTGIFTAPVSGSYFFVVTVSIPTPSPANGQDYVRIDIMKNGKLSGYLFIGTQGIWIKRSENTLLELSKGDKVNLHVRTTGSGFQRIAGGSYHSHFSGFLIN